jgi:hypothetical protein
MSTPIVIRFTAIETLPVQIQNRNFNERDKDVQGRKHTLVCIGRRGDRAAIDKIFVGANFETIDDWLNSCPNLLKFFIWT